MWWYVGVGFLAGLQRACLGAYKDSVYEPFKTGKFLRSVIGGVLVGLVLFWWFNFGQINRPFGVYLFLLVVLFETLLTELYKLFFREEVQEKYAIPSQVHIWDKKVESKGLRLGLGLGLSLLTLVVFWQGQQVEVGELGQSKLLVGGVAGLVVGLFEAILGMLKDAPFEGFFWLKFIRSPIVGMIWGAVLSGFESNLGVVSFAVAGANRMTIELYKGFIKRDGVGKFKIKKSEFGFWKKKRMIFAVPYLVIWMGFVVSFLGMLNL